MRMHSREARPGQGVSCRRGSGQTLAIQSLCRVERGGASWALAGGGPGPQVLGTCKAGEGEQVRRGTCRSTEPACSVAAEAGGAVAWHLCCCHGDNGGAN